MRDRIIKVFIEKKKKPIKDSLELQNAKSGDELQQHLLQKPINTGYSKNIP